MAYRTVQNHSSRTGAQRTAHKNGAWTWATAGIFFAMVQLCCAISDMKELGGGPYSPKVIGAAPGALPEAEGHATLLVLPAQGEFKAEDAYNGSVDSRSDVYEGSMADQFNTTVPEHQLGRTMRHILAHRVKKGVKIKLPHFSTCAVVSNSASILNSGKGGEIDSHEAVIRVNFPHTKGYEADAGSKTTIVMVTTSHLEQILKGQGLSDFTNMSQSDAYAISSYHGPIHVAAIPYVREADKTIIDTCQKYAAKHRMRWHCFPLPQKLGEKAVQAAFRLVKAPSGTSHKPSTGWLGMWGVIAMCAKTDLYGFGRHGPGHYWRPEVVDYARHNMDLEHKAFFNLAAESYGKVTVAW